MITIYGIRNCDTVKKSLRWFDDRQIPYRFHDYKKEGLDEALLASWLSQRGWQALINRQGTTWRKLGLTPEMMETSALSLILANLSMIKRPLIVEDDGLPLTGFEPAIWENGFISAPRL